MLKGSGAIIRANNTNPPKVRSFLKTHGSDLIQSITLVRTPLSKATKWALNLVANGQLASALKEIGVEELFHLSMIINEKYTFEKNEVIKLSTHGRIPEGSETLNINMKNKQITINQMVENTMKRMGSNYALYDAVHNNCSNFIENVLQSNGLFNATAGTFLRQKTVELFSKFPLLSRFLTHAATTAGAVVDRQLQGEGSGRKKKRVKR